MKNKIIQRTIVLVSIGKVGLKIFDRIKLINKDGEICQLRHEYDMSIRPVKKIWKCYDSKLNEIDFVVAEMKVPAVKIKDKFYLLKISDWRFVIANEYIGTKKKAKFEFLNLVRFWKKFCNGETDTRKTFPLESDEEYFKDSCESWTEDEGSGSNEGYSYGFDDPIKIVGLLEGWDIIEEQLSDFKMNKTVKTSRQTVGASEILNFLKNNYNLPSKIK